MKNWHKVQDYRYAPGPMVHEIRCPYCGYKVTYTQTEPPSECYLCQNRLEIPA